MGNFNLQEQCFVFLVHLSPPESTQAEYKHRWKRSTAAFFSARHSYFKSARTFFSPRTKGKKTFHFSLDFVHNAPIQIHPKGLSLSHPPPPQTGPFLRESGAKSGERAPHICCGAMYKIWTRPPPHLHSSPMCSKGIGSVAFDAGAQPPAANSPEREKEAKSIMLMHFIASQNICEGRGCMQK